MARYASTSVVISVASGVDRTQALVGDSRRVSIVIANPLGLLLRLATLSGNGTDNVYSILNGPINVVFPFRDYGPLIQGELWLSHNGRVATDIFVTEIHHISRCN